MSRQAKNAVDDIAGADLPPAPAAIGVGAAVCVWNYYLQQWSDGFVVAERDVRLRRWRELVEEAESPT